MKRISFLAVVAVLLGVGTSRAQETQESHDAPGEVLQVLEQAVGSWYVKLGSAGCACTVNSRANGRCVVLEGRRFADAISFTSLFGWYAPSRQVVGLIVFENGESLLVRATIHNKSDQFTAEGIAVGVLGGKPVKATYKTTCGANAWSIEVRTDDGEIIKGHMQSTGSR